MTHLNAPGPLLAQQYRSGSSYNNKYTKYNDEPAVGVLGWVAAALVVGLMIWYARSRWVKLRPKMTARPGTVAERERPGVLAENLSAERWTKTLGTTLKGAEAALASDGSTISAKAAEALRAVAASPDDLAKVTREAATAAVETGKFQSLLLPPSPTAVYALVCPARHINARFIRRHRAFADGWLDHAARLWNGLAKDGQRPDVLCLLIFLGPDARDGSLAVAYESEDGRLATAELIDGDTARDHRPLRRAGGWSFQIAGAAEST